MAFAQEMIDSGFVTDIEKTEKLAELAAAKAAKGPPASDPFDDDDDAPAYVQAGPAGPAGGVATSARPSGAKGAAAAPNFDFKSVATLADDALAAAMRELLKATASHGASDLHLSTAARPFIRKNRALAELNDLLVEARRDLTAKEQLAALGQLSGTIAQSSSFPSMRGIMFAGN